MEITSVNVRKIEKEGSKVVAVASVLFDDVFAVHDIRLLEGKNGLFIAMPSRKISNGSYKDVAHPINQEFRVILEEKIKEKYNEIKEEA
jgi:putative septation protein spoVG